MNLARLVTRCFHSFNPRTPVIFRLELPDGSAAQNRTGEPHLKVKLKSWGPLFRYPFMGSSGFAIDYMNQKIDIEGDLRYLGFLSAMYSKQSRLGQNERNRRHQLPFEWFMNRLHMLKHMAWNYKNAQYNAEYHYGHDPEFYFNYLGPTGAYSTGIWYENTKNVDEAQHNKWEFILRKLLLKPGMRILSVGSGFGYGEMLAAEKYDVHVDCVNVCRPQNKWLRGEVKRRGLEDKIRIIDDEYRALHRTHAGEYDRLLAIECLEHAGNLFRKETINNLAKCLKDEGVGIFQFLSWDINSDVIFYTHEYLYPAVTMPPMPKVMEELVLAGCEIVDLACFRRDYNYTLNAWTENFLRNWDKIVAINPEKYTESFMRKWYLYLCAGAYYLITPDTTARLYQITFTKGTTTTYPMHRDFLYLSHASRDGWVQPDPWAFYTNRDGSAHGREPHIPVPSPVHSREMFETFDPTT